MTMITPSYLGETIEYSSLHACRSTLEDPTTAWRYLDVLCADGVLTAGAKGSKATRKASRFRVIDLEQEGANE